MNPLATSAVAQARTVLSTRSRRRVALGLVAALAIPGALVLPAAAAPAAAPCSSAVKGAAAEVRDVCAQAATIAATFMAPEFEARADAVLANSTSGGDLRSWTSASGYAATDDIRYQTYYVTATAGQKKSKELNSVPVEARAYASRQRTLKDVCYFEHITTTVKGNYYVKKRQAPVKVQTFRYLYQGKPGKKSCFKESDRSFVRSTSTTSPFVTLEPRQSYFTTPVEYVHNRSCNAKGKCATSTGGTVQLQRHGTAMRMSWWSANQRDTGVANASWKTTPKGMSITGR